MPLNARFSLVADLDVLRTPPAAAAPVSAQQIEAIYAACDIDGQVTPADRLPYMRRVWAACQPLVRARRWAVEPLAHAVRHAIMLYSDAGNYAHVLALACFAAQHIDPYKYPAPFAQWRVKGLLVIAKTLPHVVPLLDPEHAAAQRAAARGDPLQKVHAGVFDLLPELADGGLFEALLLMVIRNGPLGHSDVWPPLDEARQMIADVRSAPDHAIVSQALECWADDPTKVAMVAFFQDHLLSTVNKLSALGLEILEDLMK